MTVTGSTCVMTVTGKRWMHRWGTFACEYRCSRCRTSFTRPFNDRYPDRCPRCDREVTKVRGELAMSRGACHEVRE